MGQWADTKEIVNLRLQLPAKVMSQMEQICFANIAAGACLYNRHQAFIVAAQTAYS